MNHHPHPMHERISLAHGNGGRLMRELIDGLFARILGGALDTRVDAAVFYEVSDRVELQVNVENLTDADYFPSAHTDNNISTGKPLNARLSVRLKF